MEVNVSEYSSAPADQARMIEDYYDQTSFDYSFVWQSNRHHSLHFGFWDESTKSLKEALLNENKILAGLVSIMDNDTVLDAGCGVGGSGLYLAGELGCRVTGISLSTEQIRRARELTQRAKLEHLIDYQVCDFHRVPFPDEAFSVVWCIESFCHSWDKQSFINEAYRLLKPGGALLIADGFTTCCDADQDSQRLMRSWLDGWAVPDLPAVSKVRHWMTLGGFAEIQFKDFTESIAPSSKMLYEMFRKYRLLAILAKNMGLRNGVHEANVRAARDQYLALQAKLWEYGALVAWKS